MAAVMSLRAYAAHRKARGLVGGSLQAVQRAIETERLKGSLTMVDGHPRIADAELADREWADNTDNTRRTDADRDVSPIDDGDESRVGSFSYWKARKMELDYRKASGELVNAAEMQAAITETFSIVRNRLLGVPNKLKQLHPDLTLAVLATLDEEIRDALEELADGIASEGVA